MFILLINPQCDICHLLKGCTLYMACSYSTQISGPSRCPYYRAPETCKIWHLHTGTSYSLQPFIATKLVSYCKVRCILGNKFDHAYQAAKGSSPCFFHIRSDINCLSNTAQGPSLKGSSI